MVTNRSKVSKILVVLHALRPGGAEGVAVYDAISLSNQGFAVGLASERGTLEKELHARAIRFHRLYFVDPERYPKWLRYLLGLPISTVILFDLVLRHKYDCLYVHHRQSGIPSTVVSWLTGAKYVFISSSEQGKYNRGRFLTPLGQHVIAVSEQVKRNVITNFHVPVRMVTVIPNATKTDVVKVDEKSLRAFDEEWSIPTGSQVVACVASLVKVKGHDILLSAWKQVIYHFPQAVLILTGDGPLKKRLQSQCKQLGIAQCVRFLGYVDDISIIYSRASLVVLASRSEGLPLCILEAFAYGLPAVATAVSGTPEIVMPEKTGLLVEPDNPEQLAQAIMRLLSDTQLRQQLGQAGRHLVVEKYSASMRELVLGYYFRDLGRKLCLQ